eukprot:gene21801-biopygen13228
MPRVCGAHPKGAQQQTPIQHAGQSAAQSDEGRRPRRWRRCVAAASLPRSTPPAATAPATGSRFKAGGGGVGAGWAYGGGTVLGILGETAASRTRPTRWDLRERTRPTRWDLRERTRPTRWNLRERTRPGRVLGRFSLCTPCWPAEHVLQNVNHSQTGSRAATDGRLVAAGSTETVKRQRARPDAGRHTCRSCAKGGNSHLFWEGMRFWKFPTNLGEFPPQKGGKRQRARPDAPRDRFQRNRPGQEGAAPFLPTVQHAPGVCRGGVARGLAKIR